MPLTASPPQVLVSVSKRVLDGRIEVGAAAAWSAIVAAVAVDDVAAATLNAVVIMNTIMTIITITTTTIIRLLQELSDRILACADTVAANDSKVD